MSIDFKSAPFDEAISYLENRIALPSERWNDYKDSEANAAFWSAGAVDATLVSDLQKSLTRAIQSGVPYDSPEFAAQIANFSEQYGWNLKGGADWRARLILSQNLRQSYAAGRHDQQFDPDVMKLQPYLQYLHSDSRAPRPAHVALDGKVFRKDDPIVSSIYPPNGFNCGCSMIALSQRQLDKKGLETEQIALGDTLPYVDGNGQTKQAIIKPDDGFNAAPSSNAEQRQANLERIKERLPSSWGKRIDSAIANSFVAFSSQGDAAARYEKYKANIEQISKPTKQMLAKLEQLRQEAGQGDAPVESKKLAKSEPKATPQKLSQAAKDYIETVDATNRMKIQNEILNMNTDIVEGDKSKITKEVRNALVNLLGEKFPIKTSHQEFVRSAETKFKNELKVLDSDGINGAELIRKRLIDESPLSSHEAKKAVAKVVVIADPAQEKLIRDELAKIYRTIGKEIPIDEILHSKVRAYANFTTGGVALDIDDPYGVPNLWHEVSHFYEWNRPDISLASRELVRSRATDSIMPLDHIAKKNYAPDEAAYPDKFADPYTGKVYLHEKGDQTTEVVSMGFETFSKPQLMADLYAKDPEHFKYILGIMHSKEPK